MLEKSQYVSQMPINVYPSPKDLHECRILTNRSFLTEISSGFIDVSLSAPEENDLRMFFERKILDICKIFKFSTYIQTSAILLHKRFYLKNSVMKHDAKHIMVASIFVAMKVGNIRKECKFLTSKVSGIDEARLLECECILLQDVRFVFQFPDVEATLMGYLMLIRKIFAQENFTLATDVVQKIPHIIRMICLSDVLLLYSVNEAVLGGIIWSLFSSPTAVIIPVEKTFQHCPFESPESTSNRLCLQINQLEGGLLLDPLQIGAVIHHFNQYTEANSDHLKSIDAKLKVFKTKINQVER